VADLAGGQQTIVDYKINGEKLFFPNAEGWRS
jgi:ABC-type tungstate transport system permease subunit